MIETPRHVLCDDLSHWEVTLSDGSLIPIRAHSYGEDQNHFVFNALMEGTPPYLYELVRIPRNLVSDVNGGWVEPRTRLE